MDQLNLELQAPETKAKPTRLQDHCGFCGKVAREAKSSIVETNGDAPNKKFIFLECGHLIIKEIPKGTPFESLISNAWRPAVVDCQHEWDLNRCKHCNESKLFPFQVEGSKFLESALAGQNGGAIFDEMGLGKTVQALAYLKFHKETQPVLFVLKSGIKFQWFKEVLKWLGPEWLGQIIESSRDFIIPNAPCYFVSYDLFTRRKSKNGSQTGKDISDFSHCKTLVLDECQQIKSGEAKRTKEIQKLAKDKQVIALSGTPWKNRGSEFFSILNMLAPMKFPTFQGFLDRWVDFYFDGQYVKQGGIQRVPEFKAYIQDIALRREVSDVAIEMPEVSRTLHYTELEGLEEQTYDEAEGEFVKWFNEQVIGGDEDKPMSDMNILAQMARMRHITGLAKIPATLEYVEDFYNETDRKLVIFVHHRDVGDILYKELKAKYANKGVQISKLTAESNGQERFEIAERFQTSKRAFMVASTLASGEGINLQTCGDAILHERQWNPQNEDQAAPGRFRRIGASHNRVNVTFMTAAGTIDEILADIVERKRGYFHNAMNQGEQVVIHGKSIVQELAEGLVANQKQKNKIQKAASLPSLKKKL